MCTNVLRVSQILGYFPIPNGSRRKIVNFLPIVSTLAFCIFGVGNIFIFVPFLCEEQSIKGATTRGGRQLVSSTFYSTILIKGAVHIFAVIFVRFTLFLRREELSQFYREFISLLETFSTFSLKTNSPEKVAETGPARRNRYEIRLRLELILLYLSCIAFIADMWEGYLVNPVKGGTH